MMMFSVRRFGLLSLFAFVKLLHFGQTFSDFAASRRVVDDLESRFAVVERERDLRCHEKSPNENIMDFGAAWNRGSIFASGPGARVQRTNKCEQPATEQLTKVKR